METRADHRDRFWGDHDKSDYQCPGCGRGSDEVTRFEVHHRDGDVHNGDTDNLIALCRSCHHDRHGPFTDRYTNKGAERRRQQAVGWIR
jgi:5-methylcytosine-specific restriction endonuclease McrA